MDRSRRPSRPHHHHQGSGEPGARRASIMPEFTAPVSRRGSLAFAGRKGSVVHIGRRRSTLRRPTPASAPSAGAGHEPWISHPPEVFYPIMRDVDPDDPDEVAAAINPPDPEAARKLLLKPIRNKKSKKAANRVARPPNAWIIYRSHILARLKAEGRGDILKVKQATLSSRAGMLWSSETQEVKDYYHGLMNLMRTSHKELHPEWRYQPRRPDGQPYRPPKTARPKPTKSRSSASQSQSKHAGGTKSRPTASTSSSAFEMDSDSSTSPSFAHIESEGLPDAEHETTLDRQYDCYFGSNTGVASNEPVSPGALQALSRFSLSSPDHSIGLAHSLHDDFDATLRNYTFPAVDLSGPVNPSSHELGLSFNDPMMAMPPLDQGEGSSTSGANMAPSSFGVHPFFSYQVQQTYDLPQLAIDPLLPDHPVSTASFVGLMPAFGDPSSALTDELRRLQRESVTPMSRQSSSLPSWSSSCSEAPSSSYASLAEPTPFPLDHFLVHPIPQAPSHPHPHPPTWPAPSDTYGPLEDFAVPAQFIHSPPASLPNHFVSSSEASQRHTSRQQSPATAGSTTTFSLDEWPDDAFVASAFSSASPASSPSSSVDVPVAAVVYNANSPMSRSPSGLRYEL